MHIKLKQFEGPLHILLFLIQKQKLDIAEISLAAIADQYFELLQSGKNISFDVLINFLDIASVLLVLKANLLLPYIDNIDENDEAIDLVARLKKYQKYIDAACVLLKKFNDVHYGSVPVAAPSLLFDYTKIRTTVSSQTLHRIMLRISKDIFYTPKALHVKRLLSIQEKIDLIFKYIKQCEQTLFSELMPAMPSKNEIIITFLALLELAKRDIVHIWQKNQFSDIYVKRIVLQYL